MALQHTFGDSCMLKEESNTFTRRASSVALDPPKITAQFFYCSPLHIDDPLAAVPPPSSSTATKSSRVPPRPFSVHDNLALDQAWLNIPKTSPSPANVGARKRASSGKQAWREDHSSELYAASIPPKPLNNEGSPSKPIQRGDDTGAVGGQAAKGRSLGTLAVGMEDDSSAANNGGLSQSPFRDDQYTPATMSQEIAGQRSLQEAVPVGTEELAHDQAEKGIMKSRRSRSFFHRNGREDEVSEDISSSRTSPTKLSRDMQGGDESKSRMGRSPDTTGTPFLRVPARLRRSRSRSPNRDTQKVQVDGAASPEGDYRPKHSSPLGARPRFPRFSSSEESQDGNQAFLKADLRDHHLNPSLQEKTGGLKNTHVTVGVSRLHVVELPSLKMGPIYWDPIHDVSSVVRGTWFYKDTMWPVESDLANRIEEGYEYIKPWTPTYIDELNSCMEIGPEAELKVIHKIWPTQESEASRRRRGTGINRLLEPEEQKVQEAEVVAGLAGNRAAGILEGFEPPADGPLFAKSSIIYVNARDAQILRPNQLPSSTLGRRVLGNVRKGRAVGIPVVRGFDMKAWEKLTPLPSRVVPVPQPMSSETAKSLKRRKSCLACDTAQDKPIPTDLILVVHGIGQKLSERVESFHFTHAINAFRRQVNLELNDETVKPWLRPELGGVMVLPINWRSTLKLEGGGPEPDPNHKIAGRNQNQFTLKDITAESLPAVRNLISDVMLDIPYYLSHHKPKMIEAVITEANRVYRLWCTNNPGFHDLGRVHLLAHSLGSVMALDILSKQPTSLPRQVDFPKDSGKARTDIFEFDTKSLFFCGSPAGFFLLLNRAPLIPRSGRVKPDAELEGSGLAGQVGTFGCLAVDNLYNIMHYNDPVAYRLNACVDVDYATALQPATIPSGNPGWGQYLSAYFRSKTIAPTNRIGHLNDLPRRPTTARLPTTVELETHDFTKEEVAEKRMFLLNDNGQIDYTLPSGGGPLEIQYLNMLGAHSSYWTRKDFVRFLVIEVGRKQGKTETVSTLKAVKKAFGKK